MQAYFNRFVLTMSKQAALDCSHSGACDDDVKYWSKRIARPRAMTKEALKAELKDYGAWDNEELANDDDNWLRIVWLAAGDIKNA